jgi:hypothetical protein
MLQVRVSWPLSCKWLMQFFCGAGENVPDIADAVGSGEAQTIERLWEEYFADPSQWWDNRVDKVSPAVAVS